MRGVRDEARRFSSGQTRADVHQRSTPAAGPRTGDHSTTSEASGFAPFNILVAFDETPGSWSAVRAANNIARGLGGTLTIVHVAQPRLSTFVAGVAALHAIESARKDAEDLLAHMRRTIDVDVPITTEVLSGDPADAIVRRAAALGSDLIVVGSRRHGALGRLLQGSVSEAIMRRAGRPVLVVPASGRDGTAGGREPATSARAQWPLAA